MQTTGTYAHKQAEESRQARIRMSRNSTKTGMCRVTCEWRELGVHRRYRRAVCHQVCPASSRVERTCASRNARPVPHRSASGLLPAFALASHMAETGVPPRIQEARAKVAGNAPDAEAPGDSRPSHRADDHMPGVGHRACEQEEAPKTGGAAHTLSQQQAAQKYIQDFKLPGGPVRLHPSLLGFDTSNRDGIPMDGSRCDDLLGQIAAMGWDPEEADFGNIVVQAKPGSSELLDHNRRACEASRFLAPVIVDQLPYGTLSHSHLHQCLKNLAAGAPAEAPQAFIVNGRLSMEAVERLQPKLALSVSVGLTWTVLSHRIREVPGALELIQGAANRRASVAMKESALQAVCRLSQICSRACGPDGRVDFVTARKHLEHTMPEVAGSNEFVGMLRFVVNLGASQGPFIHYLKRFVGMRGANRDVKPQTFALAGSLGEKVPHVVCGLVIMAYTAPSSYFTDGYSRYLIGNDIRGLQAKGAQGVMEKVSKAEAVLRWFHRACEEVVTLKKGEGEADLMDFLGKLDSLVCRQLCGKHLGQLHDKYPTLSHVADDYAEILVKMAPPGCTKTGVEKPWEPAKMEDRAGGRPTPAAASACLAPRIITFEDGQATRAQDILVETPSEAVIKWTEGVSFPKEDLAKGALLHYLHMLTVKMTEIAGPTISIKRTNFGDIVVVAQADLKAGSVAFPPSVSGPSFVSVEKPTATYPPVAVHVESMGVKLVISPCVKLPPRDQPVEGYKGLFAPPYWLMSRTALAGKPNCGFGMAKWNEIGSLAFGEAPLALPCRAATRTQSGAIPLITPWRDIKEGEELCLEVPVVPKPQRDNKVVTWETSKKFKAK